MADLVPMLVRLYRRLSDGAADWPPWGQLDPSVMGGWGEAAFFKAYPWVGHDRLLNLGEGGGEYGQWLAMVPEAFAVAAHARWPHLIEVLTEAEAEAFYDQRVGAVETDYSYDDEVIDRIVKLRQLEQDGVKPPPTQAELDDRAAALDPESSARGVRPNPRKTWGRVKQDMGFSVKPGVVRRRLADPPSGQEIGRVR